MSNIAKLVRVRALFVGLGCLAMLAISACAYDRHEYFADVEGPMVAPVEGATVIDEWDRMEEKPIFDTTYVYEYDMHGVVPWRRHVIIERQPGSAQVVASRYPEEDPLYFGPNEAEWTQVRDTQFRDYTDDVDDSDPGVSFEFYTDDFSADDDEFTTWYDNEFTIENQREYEQYLE